MLLHAYRRKEPVDIELFGLKVEFKPNEAGHMVSEVTHSAAIDRLLSIPEAYCEYGVSQAQAPQAVTQSSNATAPESQCLYGSSTLPSEIELAEDRFVTLSDVVAAAHERSGLTVEAWNAIPEAEREALLNAEVDVLRKGLQTTDEDDLAQEEADRKATAKALADAVAAEAAAKAAAAMPIQEGTDAPVSLVLTNDAGETLDLTAWTAKQVREFAADAGIDLPTGNSTPVATLRQLLAKGLTAKSA
jgi:hypothetical protein